MTSSQIRLFIKLLAVLSLVAVFFSIDSCSKKQRQGIAQSEWEKLIAIRTETNQFYSEFVADKFNAEILGQPSRLEEICARYQTLASPDNIRLVQKIEDSYQPSPEERQVHLLRLFLTRTAMKIATCQSEEYLRVLQLQEQVKVGNATVGYSAVKDQLASETNRERRRQLFEALLPAIQKENAILSTIRTDEDSVLFDLGYGNMTSFLEDERACDLAALSQEAEHIITDTDSLTRALLSELSPKLTGLQADELRGYDIPLLLSGRPFVKSFPSARMIDGIEPTLKNIGLNFDSLSGLKLTTSDNAGRHFNSAIYPVEIPADIRVAVELADGPDSYSEFYRQLGRALQHANTTEHGFEFTCLDNGVLLDMSSSFFDHLLDDPAFLAKQGLASTELKEYLRYRVLVKLIELRSSCGALLYEQSLYSGADDAKTAFEQIMQPLLGYPWSEIERESYLRDAHYLRAADQLRGSFFAAQLEQKLKSSIGADYLEQSATGNQLRTVWSAGSRIAPDSVAQTLGLGKISPDDPIQQIRSMLQ